MSECVTANPWSGAHADLPDEAEESAGEADEQALQGEASGVSMYKRIQATSAASLQRHKAARMQVSKLLLVHHVTALICMPQTTNHLNACASPAWFFGR